MTCARLSRTTGFVRNIRKKISAEIGSIIACGTLSPLVQSYLAGCSAKCGPTCRAFCRSVEGVEFTMPQSNKTSKRKRQSKALPVLGAAGLSLSLASVASAVPSGLGDMPTSKTGDDNRVTLGEEDVSFAPFYAFDKESEGTGVTLGEEEISDVSL